MKESLFIVSLDFELFWGVRDKRTIENYGENIRGVRSVIPALLELFNLYQIHATFATVGFLFASSKNELLQYIPNILPDYPDKKYSPYEAHYIDQIGHSEKTDIYHYAASLIERIRQFPEHEIASHTFSHYYCLENASLASFEADLHAAINIALTFDLHLKSIVFPRNQYSQEHIELCKKNGFMAFRGNEDSWLYEPRKKGKQNRLIRAMRLADSYINITGHHTFRISGKGILNIPASRFLRPYSRSLKLFDTLRLKRIKNSMTYAARKNEAYHLWWHPHNFGIHLKENLSFLEEILMHYQKLNIRYGMKSKNMQEVANEIKLVHAE